MARSRPPITGASPPKQRTPPFRPILDSGHGHPVPANSEKGPQSTLRTVRTMKTKSAHAVTRRGLLAAGVVQAAILVAAVPCHANAIVWWGAPQNIAGDGDVSTAGTLVGAFNLGASGVGDVTVNGVTFTGLGVGGSSVTSGNFNLAASAFAFGADNATLLPGPFGLSAGYEGLISSSAWTFGVPWTLTMTNLVPGATYQFQWWSSDNRGAPITTDATAGNSVSLVTTVGAYGPSKFLPGQFAIGTFVADATASQTITFGTAYFTEVNGFQLRQTSAVPDAGNPAVLLGLVMLGLPAINRLLGTRHRLPARG